MAPSSRARGASRASQRPAGSQQATHDARRNNASLIHSETVALCITDLEMRIIDASPRWRAERRLESADIIGRTLYEVVPNTLRW